MQCWRSVSFSGYLFLAVLSIATPSIARERRHIYGQAIITVPVGARRVAGTLHKLRKLDRASYFSLAREPISDSAVQVSIQRKIANGAPLSFELSSNTRNPCNAPTIKRLLRTSKDLVCEPNWEVSLTNTPNDTLLSSMYNAGTTAAGRIFLREAWDLSTGSANNVVGIIDTGMDYNHLDLVANVWTNPGEIADNSIDDDGDGYIDDVHGYDFFNNDSDPLDDHSHGTAVAGVIGAVGNNSRGVVGINWNVKMIACKAFNSAGSGSLSAVLNCLNYFVSLKHNFGVNIVVTNNSYGGFPNSIAFYNAIAATRDEGMVFAAGAGNNTSDNDMSPFYPASFDLDNIIVAAAINSSAALASFSNYGNTSVDVAAPGVDVLTTIPGNQYGYYQGTSIATPHLTGAIALVLAYHQDYSYSQAMSAILNSGTLASGLSGKCSTSAILNVAQALEYSAPASPTATPTIAPTPTIEPPNQDGVDLSTASLEIASTSYKAKSVARCTLTALNGSTTTGVPDSRITLTIKGVSQKRRATTNADGEVSFTVRPPRGRAFSARCSASVVNPNTNQEKLLRTATIPLRLRGH